LIYLFITLTAHAFTIHIKNHQTLPVARLAKAHATSDHQYKSDNHQNNHALGCLSITCHLFVIGASIFDNAHRLRFNSDNHAVSSADSTAASIAGLSILFNQSIAIIVIKSHAEDQLYNGFDNLFSACDIFCASVIDISLIFHRLSRNIFDIFNNVLYACSVHGIIVQSASLNHFIDSHI
jgi:hypothetical protein